MPKPRKPAVRETVTLFEAKTHLSSLPGTCAARQPGQGKGQWRVGKNFDAPLPDEVASTFE